MSSPTRIRWGVLSTARIGVKNCAAIANSVNGEMVAIASRDQTSAERVAKERNIPVAHGSYESLLSDPNVDAIYMPIPSALHVKWVEAIAKHGKHLLCDKPVGASGAEVLKIIETCRKYGVVFMDGVMFMHHPRLAYMKRIIHNTNMMGDIRTVHTSFSFPCKLRTPPKNEYAGESVDAKAEPTPVPTNGSKYHDIRLDPELEPLGVLGDLGYYNIRWTLWAFDYVVPLTVSATIGWDTPPSGVTRSVPIDVSATLTYPSDRQATFVCSFAQQFRQRAEVVGTKGRIEIPDLCLSRTDHQTYFTVNQSTGLLAGRVDETSTRYILNTKVAQEIAMFESMNAQIAFHKQSQQQSSHLFQYADSHVVSTPHVEGEDVFQGHTETTHVINHNNAYTADEWRDGWFHIAHASHGSMSFENICLLTQCVMDAVLESDKQGGKHVPIHFTPLK